LAVNTWENAKMVVQAATVRADDTRDLKEANALLEALAT
jgi:hypothetical protein